MPVSIKKWWKEKKTAARTSLRVTLEDDVHEQAAEFSIKKTGPGQLFIDFVDNELSTDSGITLELWDSDLRVAVWNKYQQEDPGTILSFNFENDEMQQALKRRYKKIVQG